ncbi:MAG: T9SS type A sorting domain-containing protein [Candidatus Eisenbacteria bacterium]|uniref:T9SS type A sorting domain-containing protein n=1 Tax=Eiseniibacteriota bacterium TaxID=2212470 RepID=A0A948S0F4_UNCEI|nr:T9SS type A sorting domain-containing protein [Candidatus Eisenbacteria bacterium]MBU1949650.1 T9SS type A sorting domain-containing protein [Candidatus Eisenbacteria bacterium]MBU2693043.1 T9SS type A sorting domain-containing protein [Candidatus Eisenbacteria bacterium]
MPDTSLASAVSDPTPGEAFYLGEGYPLPFTDTIEIHFEVPVESLVKAEIYNIQGRVLAVLIDRRMPVGLHRLIWDGREDSGHRVAPGHYYCRVKIAGASQFRKLVYVR